MGAERLEQQGREAASAESGGDAVMPSWEHRTAESPPRDLLGDDETPDEVARPVETFPDSPRVSDALRRLSAAHPLEDLLEEVVGEVHDEVRSRAHPRRPRPRWSR